MGFVAMVLVLFSGLSHAGDFWASSCETGISAESYGLGAGTGFGRQAPTPVFRDDWCFEKGREQGAQVASNHAGETEADRKRCRQAFDSAAVDGFAHESEFGYLPSDCSSIGYAFGRARLMNGMRRGDAAAVGAECMGQYGLGRKGESQTAYGNKAQFCYLTGFDDGVWLGGGK